MKSLTSINVSGDDQQVFEVYADDSREQTLGFVFDEDYADLLPAAPDLLAAAVYAEAIMSEDVLNAVTGDYAADHCIYEAINLLKAAINKAKNNENSNC